MKQLNLKELYNQSKKKNQGKKEFKSHILRPLKFFFHYLFFVCIFMEGEILFEWIVYFS